MRNSQIIRVFLLGTIAVMGIIAIQAYWVYHSWDLNETEFRQKVNLALYRTASNLSKVNEAELPPRDIIKQRTTNYYIVNLDSEIDADMLEYFLRRELENLALNIDFEYAIYDCDSDQMVYGNYCRYDPELASPSPSDDLPKHSSGFNYYFGVKFPTRSGYLFGQMQLAILFSGILLLTLLFFAYSVYVILRQKRLSDMQKDFINNMTHEFKTPLSTIRISTEVFLQSAAIQQDDRLSRYAHIISEQYQRLYNQVERVLQIAQIDRGKMHLEKKWIDPVRLLRDVLDSEQIRIQQFGGHWTAQIPEQTSALLADPFHLTNILHCLLDNAVKYAREAPRLEVGLQEEGALLYLSIADNGIGIAREHQKRIFEKFYRVPTGNVHNVKGFGLGLYYVRQVCKAHGWSWTLHSTPEQGTTITLILSPLHSNSKTKTYVDQSTSAVRGG